MVWNVKVILICFVFGVSPCMIMCFANVLASSPSNHYQTRVYPDGPTLSDRLVHQIQKCLVVPIHLRSSPAATRGSVLEATGRLVPVNAFTGVDLRERHEKICFESPNQECKFSLT